MSRADGPAVPSGGGGPVRVRLDLAYDGGGFAGWARQPGLRTVQGVVEQALATVLRQPPPVLTVAGRTDAGVHARGQVCHADLPAVPPPSLVARLDGVLPDDVRVRSVTLAPPGFDARFSALSRAYRYRVADGFRDPLRRHDTVTHRRPLDPSRMAEAAVGLVGEHDFAAYCRRREGASTVRTLQRLDVARDADGVVLLDVAADAFCHNMVRALVGALLAVGDGRRPPDWPAQVLTAGVRDPAVTVAPAYGLTLVSVRYPEAGEVGERARVTRARRGPAKPG